MFNEEARTIPPRPIPAPNSSILFDSNIFLFRKANSARHQAAGQEQSPVVPPVKRTRRESKKGTRAPFGKHRWRQPWLLEGDERDYRALENHVYNRVQLKSNCSESRIR